MMEFLVSWLIVRVLVRGVAEVLPWWLWLPLLLLLPVAALLWWWFSER